MSEKDKSNEKSKITGDLLLDTFKKKVASKILNDDLAGLADDVIKLDSYERGLARKEATPLNKLKPRRPYTFSAKAHEARINNARKSTGPRTAEGQAASSQNARKFGYYSSSLLMKLRKPCKSTCKNFGTCEVVGNGDTKPGGPCLDKVHFMEVLDTLTGAMQQGKLTEDMIDLAAVELAGVFMLKRELEDAVDQYGALIPAERLDEFGRILQQELKLNPAVRPLIEIMRDFGFTLGQQNLTPLAIQKKKLDEDLGDSATLFSKIMNIGDEAKKGG